MKTAAFSIVSTPREYHIRAGLLHIVIWRRSRGIWALRMIEGCPCLDTPAVRFCWGE